MNPPEALVPRLIHQPSVGDKTSVDSVISDPSTSNVSGTSVEQARINKLIEGDRKERARSIAIYATTNAFCCFSHW